MLEFEVVNFLMLRRIHGLLDLGLCQSVDVRDEHGRHLLTRVAIESLGGGVGIENRAISWIDQHHYRSVLGEMIPVRLFGFPKLGLCAGGFAAVEGEEQH